MELRSSELDFSKHKIYVMKNVFDVRKLHEYCLKIKNTGMLNDPQALNTPSFYNDPNMNLLHDQVKPIIENATGLKLYKTYNYFRIYKHGDILTRHIDRPACEISCTLHIGGDKKWSIFAENDIGIFEVELNDGDMLIYRGCEVPHWRDEFDGEEYTQVFIHFVDANGPFTNHMNDSVERPGYNNI